MASVFYVSLLFICIVNATLQGEVSKIHKKRMARFPTDLRLGGKLVTEYLEN